MNGKSAVRCLLVALAATAGLLALAVVVAPDLADARAALASGRLAAAPFADLLQWWCAGCALAAAGWLWCGTVALAGSVACSGPRRAARTAPHALPAPLRRLVLLACDVALAGGLAVPAQAAPDRQAGRDEPVGAGTSATTTLLDGLPLPDRATGRGPLPAAARPAVAPLPAPAHRVAGVVVQPGDTLWGLAQQALPGPASDRMIARRWHRVYALNRRLVGPDPDLIQPGQRLRLPPPSSRT